MDGICRAVGAPVPVLWDGKLLLASPLRLIDIGAIEHFLLCQRRSPLQAAICNLDGVPIEVADQLVRIAKEEEDKLPNHIKPHELQQFIETRRGAALIWWLALNRHQPISFEDVDDTIRRMSNAEFMKLAGDTTLVSGISRAAERDWLRDDEDDLDDQPASKRFNWKYAVRRMVEAYMGMTPRDIGELTLFTFRSLYIDARDVKGRRMTVAEWRAWQAKQGGKTDG